MWPALPFWVAPATFFGGFRLQTDDRLLTAGELAERLGVLESWVAKAARANRLPHVLVGRYRRFRWSDIEAWLEEQRAG